MALPLPQLDDRTFEDLMEEARTLIPGIAKAWTNHNPSDPGIMLVELFAWLTEMLVYRIDQVTDDSKRTFLRLLNEPGWNPGANMDEDIRATQETLRERNRAVTVEDFEQLAKKASQDVARAQCVPRRKLTVATESGRRLDRPADVSVVIVPVSDDPQDVTPQPPAELRNIVWEHLDSRRLLTTKHHVAGPTYVPIRLQVTVAAGDDVTELSSADVNEDSVRQDVRTALNGFFYPPQGWPFGKNVLVSELHKILERIDHVNTVEFFLFSEFEPSPIMEDSEGDLIGIKLESHHLPHLQVDNIEVPPNLARR